MPMYEYQCPSGHVTSKLRKYEQRHEGLGCSSCGLNTRLLVSAPAKTAWSWGDTNWDGFHDRGLNLTLRDKRQREQVMRARGLREVQDGEVENEISRTARAHDKHIAEVNKFQRVLQDTGSAERAMIETFPNPEV